MTVDVSNASIHQERARVAAALPDGIAFVWTMHGQIRALIIFDPAAAVDLSGLRDYVPKKNMVRDCPEQLRLHGTPADLIDIVEQFTLAPPSATA